VEEPDIVSVAIRPGTVDTEMQKDIREKHLELMDRQDADKFGSLLKDGKLLRPDEPGNVIAKLVVDAPKVLSGSFLKSVLRSNVFCRQPLTYCQLERQRSRFFPRVVHVLFCDDDSIRTMETSLYTT
jgi:hypothetical protein